MRLVYFHADWCGPCEQFGPRIEEVASENDVELEKVDVDEHNDRANDFGVQHVPSVGIVEGGTRVALESTIGEVREHL